MTHRTRSDKIENIFMALGLLENSKEFEREMVLTSLIGPHILVSIPNQYDAVITVPFEGPVVICEINGSVQRFAETGAFLEFFRRTLEPARPATLALAAVVPDSTRVGNSVVFERRGVVYTCVEDKGIFEVRYNNQKMSMAHDDIAMALA
jgi:uncharacterized protein YkuJ